MAWIGAAVGAGRRRLAWGGPTRLVLAGAGLTIGVAALAALVAWGISDAVRRLGPPGLVLEAIALKSTLSLRGLAAAARAAADLLARGDLAGARAAVGEHLVSRPTAALDEARVASAAVESVAENLTDSVVAPVLAYLILGLPGAVAYRAVNTADAMIGYHEGALEHFGKVAARLDDFLNLVPARLAALAIVAAAPLAGGSGGAAWRVMRRDGRRTASPNAGWTMAAMAGALRLALEKPGAYRLGDGRWPGPDDVRRSVRLVTWAALLSILVAAVVAAASGVLFLQAPRRPQVS